MTVKVYGESGKVVEVATLYDVSGSGGTVSAADITDISDIGKVLVTTTSAQVARDTINAAPSSVATDSADGQMSAADKTKLDGIAASANNYTLPSATTSVIGGVKQANPVADVETISVTDITTAANAIAAMGTTLSELIAALRASGALGTSGS